MPLLPQLPFLVAPYPDEILGSWLYRLRLHNHASLLQQLTCMATWKRLDKTEWRDIPKQSPALDRLLKALGISYDLAMMTVTTYPYWLRFHSSREGSWHSCCAEIPSLILKDRRQTLSRVSYLLPSLMRICPVCLAEDVTQYGEPYAHRAHHLPFVRICYKHGVELISRCPQCSQIFRMNSTFIPTRVVCACNFDLRHARFPPMFQPHSWEVLARYSADVLFSTEAFQECSRVYQFLDSRLADHGVTKRADLLAYFSDIYGPDAAKAMLCLTRQSSDTYTYSPIGWVSRRELRAPPICAFLATLDSSFSHSQALFSQFRDESGENEDGTKSVHQRSKHPRIPQSVAEARFHVAAVEKSAKRKSITRSFLYQRYKKLFWYLVLFDRDWFDRNFPPGGKGATEQLPSIEADRCEILSAIAKAPRHSVKIWTNLAQQAFFRASLRDGQWLKDRKCDTLREARKEKLAQKQDSLQACADEVKRAIERIQTVRGGLVKLSPAAIAPYSTLNESQIRHFFANNPEIRRQLNCIVDSEELQIANLARDCP